MKKNRNFSAYLLCLACFNCDFPFLIGLLALLGFFKLLGLLGGLAKLARLLVLDFEQLLGFFLQNDIFLIF